MKEDGARVALGGGFGGGNWVSSAIVEVDGDNRTESKD